MGTYHTKQKLAWRLRNPDKRRKQRQRHYDKTKFLIDKTKRRPTGVPHRPWDQYEINLITSNHFISVSDRELSRVLNRSVHAIQQKRLTLKREAKNAKD